MIADKFVQFMSDTLVKMSSLLDTEGSSFFIFQQGECLREKASYVRIISIDGVLFSLGLTPKLSNEWLMQTTTDVVANCIQEKNVDLSLESDWFICEDIAAPFEPETMAREFLLKVYQYILLLFRPSGALCCLLETLKTLDLAHRPQSLHTSLHGGRGVLSRPAPGGGHTGRTAPRQVCSRGALCRGAELGS